MSWSVIGCGGSTQSVSPQPTLRSASPQPTSRSTEPVHVDMITARTGWALKVLIIQGNYVSTLVFHTDDGGMHWKDVTPPKYTVALSSESFYNAYDLDGNTAWVLGWRSSSTPKAADTVLHTVDAGLTWQAAPLPIPTDYSPIPGNDFIETNITFVDPLNGWIMLHLTQGAIPDAVAILHTMDGGKTWTKVYDDGKVVQFQPEPSPAIPGRLPFYVNHDVTMPIFKGGISFRKTSDGWVALVGDNDYVTHDAGHSWQQQMLQPPPSLKFKNRIPFVPAFFTSTDGILPVDYDPAGLVIYVTHDGGMTWHSTTPVNFLGMGVFLGKFINIHHGWTTDGQFLYETNDSGHTWTTIVPDVSFEYVLQLDFASVTIGWAIIGPDRTNPSELLKTTDGGHTWNPIQVTQ